MSKVHVPTVKTGSHARAKEYVKDSGEFKSIKADFMCRNDSYTTGYQEHQDFENCKLVLDTTLRPWEIKTIYIIYNKSEPHKRTAEQAMPGSFVGLGNAKLSFLGVDEQKQRVNFKYGDS